MKGADDRRMQEAKEPERFDAVVCCVGTYHDPNLPDVKGMKTFPGRQLHCHNYRNASSFAMEAVLVVGASFSGSCFIAGSSSQGDRLHCSSIGCVSQSQNLKAMRQICRPSLCAVGDEIARLIADVAKVVYQV